MLRLDLARIAFLPGDGVVKAGDYRALAAGEALLAEARGEAARVVAEAQEEFRRQCERGYAEGLRKGQAESAEQMLQLVSRGVNFLHELEATVANLVMVALEQMIGAMDDRELLTKVVRKALSVVRERGRVTVRVHPDQVMYVEQQLGVGGTIAADAAAASRVIDVAPDPVLGLSDCVIETELGMIDATLDVQIEAIRKTLLHAVGSVDGRTGPGGAGS